MLMNDRTLRLFDDDAYLTEFDARIVEICDTDVKGMNDIILDRTSFFPEEGGQSCDRGTIEGLEVRSVQVSGDRILHRLHIPEEQKDGFGISKRVHGSIDFEHRFSNMQNHTGEHILSGLIWTMHGFHNTGFHLSDNSVTLQFSGILSQEQLEELEMRANEAVWKNLPVHAYYPEQSALRDMFYRSKKEIDGPVRIVTIEGIDSCACCAPHVRNTGEIGMIRILDAQRMADEMRLTILCGKRALAETRARQNDTAKVMKLTSSQAGDTAEGVRHILEENVQLKEKAGFLSRQYIAALSDKVPAEAVNVFLFEDIPDVQYRRELVNLLTAAHPGGCGVFTGSDAEGYSFIIGCGGAGKAPKDGGDNTKGAVYFLEKLKDSLQARGGGSPQMVQGSVNAVRNDIMAVLNEA